MPSPAKQIPVWALDPLEKVFRSTVPPAKPATRVRLEAARGEVVSGQIVLRADGVQAGIDRVEIAPLRMAGSDVEIPVERRWVGYTYVPKPAWGVDPERLEGEAPGLYPDPLYPVYETQTHPHHYNPDHSAALFNGRPLGLWLTARVPFDAPPGEYRGTVTITLSYWGDLLTVPVRLTVHAATLPTEPTCGVENWFVLASVARQHEVAWWSDEFWTLAEAYLRNMAAHRQTHIVVPMYELIDFHLDADGALAMDWARFDRYVEMALGAGLRQLSGNHLATYTYDNKKFKAAVHTFQVVDGQVVYRLFEGRTKRAQEWLAWFLPQLQAHLAERGWLDRWWQHVRDEPCGVEKDYAAIWRAIRQYAPAFRTIDALHGPIVKACDCWVPQLAEWGQFLDFFQARQQAGDQVWTYVCCEPTGKYANRFIDQQSVLPRLIFWIMARYGATGYLHWGYNWTDGPVSEIDTTGFLPAQGPVQSGDCCVVYPGPHGPRDSIRWEMQREGLQDYELLRLLAAEDPKKADAIAARLVKGFDEYNTDVVAFRAARRALLRAVGKVQGFVGA